MMGIGGAMMLWRPRISQLLRGRGQGVHPPAGAPEGLRGHLHRSRGPMIDVRSVLVIEHRPLQRLVRLVGTYPHPARHVAMIADEVTVMGRAVCFKQGARIVGTVWKTDPDEEPVGVGDVKETLHTPIACVPFPEPPPALVSTLEFLEAERERAGALCALNCPRCKRIPCTCP